MNYDARKGMKAARENWIEDQLQNGRNEMTSIMMRNNSINCELLVERVATTI